MSGNNRNILECKCLKLQDTSDISDREIIETYWNVNQGYAKVLETDATRNNRNILECKSL